MGKFFWFIQDRRGFQLLSGQDYKSASAHDAPNRTILSPGGYGDELHGACKWTTARMLWHSLSFPRRARWSGWEGPCHLKHWRSGTAYYRKGKYLRWCGKLRLGIMVQVRLSSAETQRQENHTEVLNSCVMTTQIYWEYNLCQFFGWGLYILHFMQAHQQRSEIKEYYRHFSNEEVRATKIKWTFWSQPASKLTLSQRPTRIWGKDRIFTLLCGWIAILGWEWDEKQWNYPCTFITHWNSCHWLPNLGQYHSFVSSWL